MSGHIRPAGPGRYRVVVEAGRDPATGRRKRIVRMVKGRKSQAEELLAKLISDLSRGDYVEPSRVTFGSWLDTWLNEYKRLDLRPTTWESYEIMARVHLKPALGAVYLKDLRPEHLQKLYNEKLKSGLSPRTVRYIHHVACSALKQAVKNQLILRNPAEATTLPAEKKRQVRALTQDEEKRLLRVLSEDRLGPAFLVLLGTGLRRGELLALQWRDVDFEAKTLRISKGLVRTGDGLKIQDAKTEKSNRIVPLAPALVEVLKEHRKKMFEEGNYGLDRPVFCTRNGTHIVPRNLNRKFDQILRRAGIEDVTLHSLRHTFATRLLELGENLKVVQELLGHARIAVTADTYSHVSQDLKRQAVEKIDRILRGK